MVHLTPELQQQFGLSSPDFPIPAEHMAQSLGSLQNNQTRPPTIYVGANDGMLHAFDASTIGSAGANTSPAQNSGGRERWAYIPSQVLPNLWHLADDDAGDLALEFRDEKALFRDLLVDFFDAEFHV